MTIGHELKALDAMNNSKLWMSCCTMGHDLRTPDAMNNSELLIIGTTQDPVSSDLLML